MTKAVYAIFFFISILTLTFTLSFQAVAQEKATSYSYLAYFKQAILRVKPATLTITPTPKLTAAPTPTAKPKQVLGATTKPTATPTTKPKPTAAPTTIPSVSLSAVSDYLLKEVNKYRENRGLPAVSATAEVCAFAATRASEIAKHFTHEGFNTRVKNKTLPYANWTRATENIAETPNYKDVVSLWINSPEHAANMRDNTPYVCVAQNGNSYAYEGMRP